MLDLHFPLHTSGALSGLICGVLFGFILENAGFGSPLKLTSQFRLTDWSVFKVMFVIPPDSVAVPQALVMASAVGGVLVGAGFAIGGYCPGTSVAGLASGRLDALVFIVGLLVGTFAFVGLYGPTIRTMMAMGSIVDGDTFTDAYGVAEPIVLAALAAALVAVFYFGSWFERRGPGPVSAEQAVAGAE